MPKVFIIILNWNGWGDTFECLKSLNDATYDNFEIILIDNASKEKTRFSRETFPKLKITQVFNEYNLGFAGGNNQGIKKALDPPAGGGADYILLLNNDTIIESDFLTKLIEAAESDSRYGIWGPVIYDYDNHSKIQFAGGKINWAKTKGTHITFLCHCEPRLSEAKQSRPNTVIHGIAASPRHNGGSPRDDMLEVDYITGCCLLIKREVIEKIGLLSEDYFLYYEDTDWNRRARHAGWLCGVVLGAKIYHKASKSTQEFSYPYIYYHSRNGLIFASRFGSKFTTYLISIWIFAKQLIKLIVGYKRDWAGPVLKGVMDFWKGKTGKLEGYY